MAEVFFNCIEKLGNEKISELKDLLKFTRWTLNFEFEYPSHQHIVPLHKEQLVLIGCSGIHVPCGKASHPILGCSIARYFQFPSVLEDLTIYEKDQLNTICSNVAVEWETEGSVLILLDDENNVVDFVKVKAWWYILLRSIREKVRKIKTPDTLSSTCEAIVKRIKALTRAMKIGEDYSKCFIHYGTKFAEWLCEIDEFGNLPKMEKVVDLYPTLWENFLKENNLPLDSSLIEVFKKSPDFNSNSSEGEKYSRANLPLLILMQGIPGIGKSYLAKKLSETLNNNGFRSRDIAQDDFVAEHTLKKSGAACLNYIRGALIRREFKCIILARNNSNIQQYRSYLDLDSEGICRVVFISPKELDGGRIKEAVLLSVAGVLYRQNSDESHPTDDMETCALASLPLKFFGSFNIHPSAFRVPVMKDEPITIPNPSKFDSVISNFKSKGFKAKDISASELKDLGIDDNNKLKHYLTFRRDINDMTAECFNFIKEIIAKDTPIPGSYLSVRLHSDSSNNLMTFASTFFKDSTIPRDWNTSCDHVTLIHSNSYFTSNEKVQLWENIQSKIGCQISIRPVSLLVNDQLAAIRVDLFDESGENINSLVDSNIPHVTIACAPGVKAYESGLRIVEASNLTDVSNEAPFSGEIDLIDFSN